MSAAGSARLALVPPGPVVPPPVRSAPAAGTGARVARARRVSLRIWVTACALVVGGTLLSPMNDRLSLAAMLFAGAFLLPMSGLAGFCLVLYERSREAAQAFVVAILSLVSVISLSGPAHRAGIEMHFAANQAELDALAAEVRAASASVPVTAEGWTDNRVLGRFRDRLEALDLASVAPVEGGLLFRHGGEFSFTLLYADGAAGPPGTCRNVRPRFLGGRWYAYDCRDRSAGDDDG